MSPTSVQFISSSDFFHNEFQFQCCIFFHYWVRAMKRQGFRLEWGCTASHQNILQLVWIKRMNVLKVFKAKVRGICWFANGAEAPENIQYQIYRTTKTLLLWPLFYTWPLYSFPNFHFFLLSCPCIFKYSSHHYTTDIFRAFSIQLLHPQLLWRCRDKHIVDPKEISFQQQNDTWIQKQACTLKCTNWNTHTRAC